MTRRLPALSLLAFNLLFTATAQAASASGAWQFQETLPENPASGVCQASSVGLLGHTKVAFELMVDKSGVRPLELLLESATPTAATAFSVRTDSGAIFYFAKLANGQYWGIPTNTEQFVADLKSGSRLTFIPVAGTNDQLPISLSGSTNVIKQLEARCLTGGSLYTARAFEQAFLPSGFDRFDIKTITSEKAEALRTIVVRAVPAYLKLKGIQAELDALTARNQALVNERAQLAKDLENLGNVQLPKLHAQRNGAQAKIDQATNEINQLVERLAASQASLRRAQEDAANALARLNTLTPELNRLASRVSDDKNRVASARDLLTRTQNALNDQTRTVQNLVSQSEQLRNNLSQAQRNVQNAQSSLAQANNAARAFNPTRDAEDRFNRESAGAQSQLRQANADLQSLPGQVQALNSARNGQRFTVDRSVENLKRCRASHPARPDQSCGSEISSLRTARSQLANTISQLEAKQSQLAGAHSRRDQAQNSIASIRQNAVQQAAAKQRDLANRVTQAQQSVAQAQSNVNTASGRLRDVENNDLPRARQELANLQTKRTNAASAVTEAMNDFTSATAILNNFLSRTNFAGVRAEVNRTAMIVNQIQDRVAELRQSLSARTALVNQLVNLRGSLDTQITSGLAAIAQKQARLGDVNTALAAFDAAKAEIQARIDEAAAALKVLSDEYAANLA